MPRIKRFHPISHDFVRDPEVQELRLRFGDWCGYVWLEMLSIADRNLGHVKGDPLFLSKWARIVWVEVSPEVYEEMTHSERRLSKFSALRVRQMFEWMVQKAWIVRTESGFYVCNYPLYHPRREQRSSLLPSLLPSLPPKDKEKTKDLSPELLAPNIRGWLEQTQHMQSLSNGKHVNFWKALESAYDGYDWLYFEEEIKKADAWMAANPKRKPTDRGMPRFFRSWLERAVERGRKTHG